jgi:hypothetical protein
MPAAIMGRRLGMNSMAAADLTVPLADGELGLAGLRRRQQQEAAFAAFDEHLRAGLARVEVGRLPLAQAGLQADLGARGHRQALGVAQG